MVVLVMNFLTMFAISAGAVLGGFLSGLAGFGTGLIAMGIWLHVAKPPLAAVLVIVCSVVSQAQTISTIWHAVDFRRGWPMLTAGVVGVPIGTALLSCVSPDHFRCGVGILLVGFSASMLFAGSWRAVSWGGRGADAVVGFAGGILGDWPASPAHSRRSGRPSAGGRSAQGHVSNI